MENENEKENPKVVGSEHYNIEKPQNQTLPKFNSNSDHRNAAGAPAIENLNQTDGLKSEPKLTNKDDSDPSTPKNDDSIFGENTKTDLGNGQRDEHEDKDERIIRQ